MKIARYEIDGNVAIGIVTDGGVVDLAKTNAGVADIAAIIAGGQPALDAIARAVAATSPHRALSDVRLLSPCTPRKYLAIGMNYGKHVAEAERLGVAAPSHQYWFNKQTSCIVGPYDAIVPGVTEKLDYEVELGVVIGEPAKMAGRDTALDHVFGYVVVNDVSARDWQQHAPTFTVGKSFDTHGPIGPWIVTADEIPDPQALNLRCLVNGAIRQESSTQHMIHSVAAQIEYLSTAFTLEPGDLLATGTPEGVGAGMQPPNFLVPGDVVRCEIDGIGNIENRVAA